MWSSPLAQLTLAITWLACASLALPGSSATEPLSDSAPSAPARRPAQVAILADDLPSAGAPSSPDHLARLLEAAGFKATQLAAADLADPNVFRRDRFDAVVLPYGPSFPFPAKSNFLGFLRQGGKFLSTGGYAFDDLYERRNGSWEPARPAPRDPLEHAWWTCTLPAADLRPHGQLQFRGWLKSTGIRGPGMAYFAVYQFGADQRIVAWKDLCQVRGTSGWQEYTYTFRTHPDAITVELRAGLFRCSGVAWFDDVRLTDSQGRAVLATGFEPDATEPTPASSPWQPSLPTSCHRQSRTAHSGQFALEATLDFEEPRQLCLNTRHGIPEDGLRVEPDQLGVFQADYHLERARYARAAPGQSVLGSDLRLDGPIQGYAAAGVVGFNQARWLPLLNAYDDYGRLRGAAGALLRHYAGPYAGSSWAFFGVTNRDLFAPANPPMSRAFVEIVRSLVRDTYVVSLGTEYATYSPRESIRILASLMNGGRQAQSVRLEIEIHAGAPPIDSIDLTRNLDATRPANHHTRTRLAVLERQLSLPPGKTNLAVFDWVLPNRRLDFGHLVGRVFLGGEEIDRMDSGFVIRNRAVVRGGPSLRFRANYLRLGRRPMFLFGTDDWGYVFHTLRETPLQWLVDMRLRRDLGVQIYENLQFPLPGSPQREIFLRQTDGLIQLAQQYGQVYFAGLFVGANTAASDAELARQREACQTFAARYRDVPGLIHYLNGDLRCELTSAVTPQWNRFLAERYPDDAALKQAWGTRASSQTLGQIDAEDFQDWIQPWTDVRITDENEFRAWLIRRWSHALISGIRSAGSTHPTSAEFYQLPHQGVDLPAAIDGLDLANFGYFDKPEVDLARFPALCQYHDQRWRGKSNGPGEYGVKTHPAWGDGKDYGYHTARTPTQAIDLFLAIAHYSFGLGASRIHNWCWKDDAHRVFPWGMVYPCDGVPKPTGYVHRNQSFLFRHFTPVYQEPEVWVLTPDAHRFGGAKWQVIEGILQAINLALASHVENLGTLNETGLSIPTRARTIFYPLPFTPPEPVYQQLLAWVRSGGVLYLSGDLSYDATRRRTQTRRLAELCGVRFEAENYPNIALKSASAEDQPCIQVAPLTAAVWKQAPNGQPLVLHHPLGRGHVVYSTDPIELHPLAGRRTQDLELYRQVLKLSRARCIPLDPPDPDLHAFRVRLEDGGHVTVLFNQAATPATRRVTLTDEPSPITLEVGSRRPALLWFDSKHRLRAVETQGVCSRAGQRVLEDTTGGIAMTLDGCDLAESHALVLMPLRPGNVRLHQKPSNREFTLETGEIQDGRWYGLARAGVTAPGGPVRVAVTEDQALSLLLLAPKPELPRWRTYLERSFTAPERLR